MDGENNGKPYENGWFGGTTIFGNIHISYMDGMGSEIPLYDTNPNNAWIIRKIPENYPIHLLIGNDSPGMDTVI